MQFCIDAFAFEIVKVLRRPIGPDGQACDGRIDFDLGMIRLWSGMTGSRLLNTLLHELRHAWCWVRPIGDGEEPAIQDAANFAQAMTRQLDAQGGLAALERLEPPGIEPAPEPRFVPVEGRTEPAFEPADAVGELDPRADRWRTFHVRDKPCCGGWVYGRRLWTGPARWLDSFRGRPIGGSVVERACYCADCRVLSRWVEAVDGCTGQPCGPIDEAEQIARRAHEAEVALWLVEHPECLDVMDEAA